MNKIAKIIGAVLIFFLSEMVLALNSQYIYYCVTDDQSEFLVAPKNFIDTLDYKIEIKRFISDLDHFASMTRTASHTENEAIQKELSQLNIPSPAECTVYIIGLPDAAGCSMCAVYVAFKNYKAEHSIEQEDHAVSGAHPSVWYVTQIPGWARVIIPEAERVASIVGRVLGETIVRGISGVTSLLFTDFVLKQLKCKHHWNFAEVAGAYCAVAPKYCMALLRSRPYRIKYQVPRKAKRREHSRAM